MKKVNIDINKEENTVVHVLFKIESGEEFECVGALSEKDGEKIRIAFNAHNDVIKDYLDIPVSQILKIKKINITNINK